MYNKKYCNTGCCNSIRRVVEYILLTLRLAFYTDAAGNPLVHKSLNSALYLTASKVVTMTGTILMSNVRPYYITMADAETKEWATL